MNKDAAFGPGDEEDDDLPLAAGSNQGLPEIAKNIQALGKALKDQRAQPIPPNLFPQADLGFGDAERELHDGGYYSLRATGRQTW